MLDALLTVARYIEDVTGATDADADRLGQAENLIYNLLQDITED